jgi:ATP-binding cassette, subfamily B, bacterial MsbA
MATRHSLWRLLARLRPHLDLVLAATLLTLATAGVTLLVPWFGRTMIDRLAASRSARDVDEGFLVIAALWTASVALGLARNVATLHLGQRVIRDLRRSVTAHVMGLPVAFFDAARVGDIIARISNDTEQLRRTLTEDAVGSLGNLGVLLGGGILLMTLDWRLTAALLVVAPAVYAGHRALAPPLRRLSRANLDAFSATLTRLGEAIGNLRLVKSLGREPYEALLAARELGRVYESSVRAGRFEAAVWTAAYGAFGLVAVGVVWYGVHRVVSGQLTLGTMLAFLYILTLLAEPLLSLAGVFARAQRAAAAADRVFEILDEPAEPDDPAGSLALRVTRGEVVFDDVTFAYATGSNVLAGFSIRVRAGATTALVGASGAGKSTVIALLQRFYEPAHGDIRIDGTSVAQVTRSSLRSSLAVVQQEALMFDGSIRDNIRYGRLDATDAEVEQAAAAAHVDEFTSRFAEGLETAVGERGVRLSGGQRQRISIARAILRNAPILLLDEATSALDAEAESLIQDALRRLTRDRTTLVIAHRLRTVQGADQIAVLAAGRAVALGTHQQLLETSDEYRRLQALLAVG